MSALLDLGSKVNVIHPVFAERLNLMVQTTNLSVQKINGIIFETYRMVVVTFSVIDQADRVKFFEKTFLVANVSPDMIFGMPFLILSSADVDFPKKEL